MAFDIYSGGFARFYAREWENVVQAHARETGMKYEMIYGGNDPGPADWDNVAEAVAHWRMAIVNGLGTNAPPDLQWSEDRTTPYFTDRPTWPGYSALVVMAACTACGEPLPERLEDDALVSEVVQRTHAPEMRHAFRSLTQAQLWLPGAFNFTFDFVDLCNQKTHVGSVQGLCMDLEDIRLKHGLTDQAIAEVLQNGYGETPTFRDLATYAFGMFSQIAKLARDNHLPILLSY